MNIKYPLRVLASNTISLFFVSVILPGVNLKWDIATISIAVIILSLVNMFLKPVVKLIAIPINFVSLGLFNIVINAGLLYFVTYFVDGFKITSANINIHIQGFIINDMYLEWYWVLLLATVTISFTNWILKRLVF